LIALSENGALRVLPAPPVQWIDRVPAQDLRAAFLRTFQAEAFFYTHSQAVEGFGRIPNFNNLSMTRYSERVLRTTQMLSDRDDSCSLDSSLGLTEMTLLRRAWVGMTMTRLDGELTRLVMETRRHAGDIAHALPVASAVCKDVSWIRSSSRDGRITISAEPDRLKPEVSGRRWTFSFRTTS